MLSCPTWKVPCAPYHTYLPIFVPPRPLSQVLLTPGVVISDISCPFSRFKNRRHCCRKDFLCDRNSHFWTPGTLDRCLEGANMALREAPPKLSPGSKGHCPNSDCTPPPLRSTGHSGALYFQTELSNFVKSPC